MARNNRGQSRLQMRCKLACDHWNEFIENLDQVVMEGGFECEEIHKKLVAMSNEIGDSLRRSYSR